MAPPISSWACCSSGRAIGEASQHLSTALAARPTDAGSARGRRADAMRGTIRGDSNACAGRWRFGRTGRTRKRRWPRCCPRAPGRTSAERIEAVTPGRSANEQDRAGNNASSHSWTFVAGDSPALPWHLSGRHG